MELRIMEYYLAVVREGNISAAAEALHVSQPALSRQIKDLEEELGVTLFERGSRRIRLTEEGMILRRRAEEMVRLMQITESEISRAHSSLTGEVHIGAGESLAFHHLSRIAGEIHKEHPDVRFTITSGDTADLLDQLDNGLVDIALIFTDYDHSQYQGIRLPADDRLGLLLSSDPGFADLDIVTVYNLIYNASLFVEDGVGYAIGFGGLVNVSGDSALAFRPLESPLSQSGTVIWKKYEVFTPAVNLFLDRLKGM